MTAGRTRCTDQALKLESIDDVVKLLVSPLSLVLNREEFISGCKDRGSYLDGDEFVLHLKIDCLLLTTGLHTQPTLDTGVKVDGIDEGHDLGMVDVDGLSWCHSHLERVWLYDRTDCCTVSTPVTATTNDSLGSCFDRGHNSTGFLAEGDIKVTDIPFYLLNLGIGHHLDVGVSADIHHLWCENTLGTVKGREGFVKLGHPATDGRGPLNQVGLDSCTGKVKGSLHTGDSTTDNHCGLLDRDTLWNEILKFCCLCNSHPDLVFCLLGCFVPHPVHVNP
ncbi:MAG: hypothetical protein BWY45_01099 [Euryarchaeota archaeon ADurb.Bin294]|nr:MAG: hypothetical protein BWY45_01099 [Euryarchaeota archaeon ADurb.Bin294]